MKIPLDRQAPKPIYLQIRDRLSRLINSGTLPPGERLPSIRTLAESLQVNKLTVIEAYSVLEADGLIHAVPLAGRQMRTLGINAKPTNIAQDRSLDVLFRFKIIER